MILNEIYIYVCGYVYIHIYIYHLILSTSITFVVEAASIGQAGISGPVGQRRAVSNFSCLDGGRPQAGQLGRPQGSTQGFQCSSFLGSIF